MSSELDIVQSLFDTKPMGMAMNWPVDVSLLVQSVGALRHLCRDESSSPSAIAEEWRKATAALGLDAMGAMFDERGEWQKLVYESAGDRKPWREHDDFVVVWEQPAGCVIATMRKRGDLVESLEFDVRKEV